MWPMRHTGLALASSLSSYVNVVGLCWLLRRRLHGPRAAIVGPSLLRTVGASALPAPRSHGALWTAIALTGGMIVYALGAAALGSTEVRGLLDMIRRRRSVLP